MLLLQTQKIQFYNEISIFIQAISKTRYDNHKIGKRKCGVLVGEHGLGVRNERGDRMKLFIEDEELIILNIFFKLPSRQLYTWTSLKYQPGRIVRNQIDYIRIPKRFRNSCLGVKTYPVADIESGHCPVVRKI